MGRVLWFNWVGCQDSWKPTSGYFCNVRSILVSWSYKKQPNITISSTEVEYKAIVRATYEAIWLRWILVELGLEQSQPTTLYYDNQSVLKIVRNPVFHVQTKFVEVHHHFIKEHVQNGEIDFVYRLIDQ